MFIGDMTPFIIAMSPMKGVSPMAFMFVGSLMNIALLCIGSPMNMNRQLYFRIFLYNACFSYLSITPRKFKTFYKSLNQIKYLLH
jgi:hypothetical protein